MKLGICLTPFSPLRLALAGTERGWSKARHDR